MMSLIKNHKMFSMRKALYFALAFFFISGISSCVKDKFDAPPLQGQDPDITANFTLDSVIGRSAAIGGQIYEFNEDLVVSAVVVADDKSGNFYQNIILEDSTAGISLRIDRSSLYTEYPVGRRLFIKLRGLSVGTFAGLYQIGININNAVEPIPSSVVDNYILKGVWGLPVVPHVVSINQLNDSYQNKLIELNGVEFTAADAGKNYADGYNKASINRNLKDCNGGNIIVRTSGYANFANNKTPLGNGKLLAVYSTYNGDGQLLIRGLDDVQLDSVRCGGGTISTNGIAGIRGLYSGTDVSVPSGKIIYGVVISDATNLNTDPKNMVVQDSTGGIVVRFTSNHSFALGDSVRIDAGGQTLSDFNGLVQLNNCALSICTKVGTGTIAPRVATVQQILQNGTAWESTLVQVQNATISGSGSTWSGSTTITDATGSITHFTRSAATFSGNSLPSGNKSFTAMVGNFNGVQLVIRNLNDVQ